MKINKDELLKNYFPQALEELKKLISFKSVADKPQEKAPFGVGNQQALDYAINLAKELGFSTYQDPENRYGFFEYGSGEKLFVILCHLDVVPPGNLEKWNTDPFQATEQEGKLIGSGVTDDKGPTMMNIFALKYLKDQNFNPDYKIRLFFGLAEETSWKSIEAYIQDFGKADFGYTPDGPFPLVYAEKSYADLDFVSTREINFEINGGDAYNVINDLVTYQGPLINETAKVLEENKIGFKIDNDKLNVYGKPGHGSMPEVGINAATWLGYALKKAGMQDPIIEYLANLHLNFDATNLLPDLSDETGPLTQNVGFVRIKNGSQLIGINYRIPAKADQQKDFLEPLRTAVKKYDLSINIYKLKPSIYFPEDSALVQKLLKIYQNITGDFKAKPLAIGGATYAKTMPNVIPFGGIFDLENSSVHSYNEAYLIEDLKKALLIYAEGIVELTQKINE